MEGEQQERVNAVLQTWFGDMDRDKPAEGDIMKKWFMSSKEFDEELVEKHKQDLGKRRKDVVANIRIVKF
jgi:uncharacterized protein (DUF924 family)